MSDRSYLFIVGAYILLSLYIEIDLMIYVLVAIMFIEGVSGFTITDLTQKMMGLQIESELLTYPTKTRFNFDGFRALRILFSVVLTLSYVAVHEYGYEIVWFFPWFLGFALLGAGVSSVCPVLLGMRWLGFR